MWTCSYRPALTFRSERLFLGPVSLVFAKTTHPFALSRARALFFPTHFVLAAHFPWERAITLSRATPQLT
jgi:hypothetical protein